MIEFADPTHIIASLLKGLGQTHRFRQIFAELGHVLVNSSCIRSKAGQERRSRRVTERELAVSSVESHALLGECVQIGSFYHLIAITPKPIRQIVRNDEKHVKFRVRMHFQYIYLRNCHRRDDLQNPLESDTSHGNAPEIVGLNVLGSSQLIRPVNRTP